MRTDSLEFMLKLARSGRPVRHSPQHGFYLTSMYGMPRADRDEIVRMLEGAPLPRAQYRARMLALLRKLGRAQESEVPGVLAEMVACRSPDAP